MILDLDTTVKELYEVGRISVRTYNSLNYGGLKTIRDIFDFAVPTSQLLHLRNMGKKGYHEVLAVLRDISVNYNLTTPLFANQLLESVDGELRELLQCAYASVFGLDNRVTHYLQERFEDSESLHRAFLGDEKGLLLLNSDFTYNENLSLRGLMIEFAKTMLNLMAKRGLEDKRVYGIYKTKQRFLLEHADFSYAEKERYFLSDLQRGVLLNRYKLLKAGLPTRAQNYLSIYASNFQQVVALLDLMQTGLSKLSPSRHLQITLLDIAGFCRQFKLDFDRVWGLDDETIHLQLIRDRYPNFSESDLHFILLHHQQYGFYPRFFILSRYLQCATGKHDRIYSLLYGFADGQVHTLYEVADRCQLTRVRIQQIVDGVLEVCKTEVIRNADWMHYQALFSLPYISEYSPEFIAIKEREQLTLSFGVLVYLFPLLGETDRKESLLARAKRRSKQYVPVCFEGSTFVLNRRLLPAFDLPKQASRIKKAIYLQGLERSTLFMSDLLVSVSQLEKKAVSQLMGLLIEHLWHLSIQPHGVIEVPGDLRTLGDELFQLIANAGCPISTEQMLAWLKVRHPDCSIALASDLLPYLCLHPQVKQLEQSGLFGLDNDEQASGSAILRWLFERLLEEPEPVSVDLLLEEVQERYPHLDRVHLVGLLENDSQRRFVQFENQLFGLKQNEYGSHYVRYNKGLCQANFSRKLAELRTFVQSHHRLPLVGNSEPEVSLHSWVARVVYGGVNVTAEQTHVLKALLKEFEQQGIPRTRREVQFHNNCETYKEFVRTQKRHPNAQSEPFLYNWFVQSQSRVNRYSDHRVRYFNDLLAFLQGDGEKAY